MKIAASYIVRDDSEVLQLRRSLASIVEYVDSLFITSTGKQVSQIKALCEELSQAGGKVYYSHFKWCDDFAAARNFNFSQVPQGYDYIWWMDADDILIGGDKLAEVAQIAKQNGKDIVFFTYWYGCAFNGEPSPQTMTEVLMEQNRERLIKPGVITWKGRLHETPMPVEGAKNNYTKYLYDAKEHPIVVMHTSRDSDLQDKMMRNKRILELQLEDERKRPVGADPRTLLYLMKIYAEQDNVDNQKKVIEMGQEYLTKSGWGEERATCYENMGKVWGKLGDNQKAVECFHNAINEWPYQPLHYVELATAYFNLQNYAYSEYWMKVGAGMDIDNKGSNLTNFKAMKMMYADLLVKLNWNAKRDTKKALEAAKMLFKEIPTEFNAQQVEFIENFDKLNDACRNLDLLCQYLDATGTGKSIVPILDALPEGMTSMPFAQKIRQKFSPMRRWGNNEICYFANFGASHFEKWDYSSLKTGIGGSETAVLELARWWAQMGYHVTIYSDPFQKGQQFETTDVMGITSGSVTVLPWYYFNPRDSFNIFIQWRNSALAGKIKCKKFYVDMHDIFSPIDFKDKIDAIDGIMVKSEYHKSLAEQIPEVMNKCIIAPNGV